MIPKSIIHLLSGGIDSVTMLYDLHGQDHLVHCLLVNYQQKHAKELRFATAHCGRLGLKKTVIEIPSLGGLTETNWVVPNRNAILISLAVNLAVKMNADTVTIGCNADDAEAFPDCRKPFIEAMNAVTKAAGYAVEICAPYLDCPKWKIGALAREIGINPRGVWTCYLGGEKPCGECPACVKLKAALA